MTLTDEMVADVERIKTAELPSPDAKSASASWNTKRFVFESPEMRESEMFPVKNGTVSTSGLNCRSLVADGGPTWVKDVTV